MPPAVTANDLPSGEICAIDIDRRRRAGRDRASVPPEAGSRQRRPPPLTISPVRRASTPLAGVAMRRIEDDLRCRAIDTDDCD